MKEDSQYNRTPLSFVRGTAWAMVIFVLIALISNRDLYQAPHDSNQTVYTVEVTSGKQGSVAVNWSKKARLR